MIMRCSNCNSAMERVTLASHMGTPVEIDVCWPCRVIWFDNLESALEFCTARPGVFFHLLNSGGNRLRWARSAGS